MSPLLAIVDRCKTAAGLGLLQTAEAVISLVAWQRGVRFLPIVFTLGIYTARFPGFQFLSLYSSKSPQFCLARRLAAAPLELLCFLLSQEVLGI